MVEDKCHRALDILRKSIFFPQPYLTLWFTVDKKFLSRLFRNIFGLGAHDTIFTGYLFFCHFKEEDEIYVK